MVNEVSIEVMEFARVPARDRAASLIFGGVFLGGESRRRVFLFFTIINIVVIKDLGR